MMLCKYWGKKRESTKGTFKDPKRNASKKQQQRKKPCESTLALFTRATLTCMFLALEDQSKHKGNQNNI